MPCYDSRDSEDRHETKKRLDLATKLLCKLTSEMKLEEIESEELRKWVKDHREMDIKKEE